jgi:molecular chaperone DnaK (HSP70)
MIGRKFNDPIIQNEKSRWPFNLSGDSNYNFIKIHIDDKLFAPEDISGFVLKKLKTNAEQKLETQITDAVITVPAYFNDSQRHATMKAAARAGLNVLRLISEPSAAALAYGLDKYYQKTRTVLIYDLGGGTFDVSILKIGEGHFKTLSTAGDTHLCGQDFDNRLLDHLIQKFRIDFDVDLNSYSDEADKRRKDKSKRKLRESCQKAKHRLSDADSYQIGIESFYKEIDYIQLVTRQEFENLNDDLFKITEKCVNDALNGANMTHDQIDDVVLVGGSTRIPKIQTMIKGSFKNSTIVKTINVDEAVATGAAIEAAKIAKLTPEDFRVVEVTPFSLGLRTFVSTTGEDDYFKKFIKRNTSIPVSVTHGRKTVSDNQTAVCFEIFEGEHHLCKDNNLLGEFTIKGVPPLPRGQAKVDATFAIDGNGILKVTAVDRQTGQEKSIEINYGKGRLAGVETRL